MTHYVVSELATAALFDAFATGANITFSTTIQASSYTADGAVLGMDLVLGNLRPGDKLAFTMPTNCKSWLKFLNSSNLQKFLDSIKDAIPNLSPNDVGLAVLC